MPTRAWTSPRPLDKPKLTPQSNRRLLAVVLLSLHILLHAATVGRADHENHTYAYGADSIQKLPADSLRAAHCITVPPYYLHAATIRRADHGNQTYAHGADSKADR
jgi:hypothetical protein